MTTSTARTDTASGKNALLQGSIATALLLFALPTRLTFGVSMVLFGTVRGNGQVVWPLIILFVSLYPIRIGLAYGARDWLGVDALWWSFPVSLTATMLMAIILYVHGGWRRPQGLNFDASTEEISVSNPTGIGGATVPSTMRSCLPRNGVTK